MKNTYWIKLGERTRYGTLVIYKYPEGQKPFNYRTDWTETTEYHYRKNAAESLAKYMEERA